MSIVSQHMAKPSPTYWLTIKKIVRYLKDSLNFKSCLGRDNITLHGYCHVDWTGDANNRRSLRGYMFFVGVRAISCNCKKKPTIARSTIEIEYILISHWALDAIWLSLLLEGIGLV